MNVYVDKETCIGCGLCPGICPDVFELNDDGKAEAYGDVTSDNEETVREALDSCPVGAIREKN